MALVDILIGVLIGFVGGVLIPAAVLYRYRHRIGQWVIERQAKQTFEGAFDLEGPLDGADVGGGGFDEASVSDVAFGDAGPTGDGPSGAGPIGHDFDSSDTVEAASEGTVETSFEESRETVNAPDTVGTVVDSEDETGRCDCGELVSPQLDEACPNCGAPVTVE